MQTRDLDLTPNFKLGEFLKEGTPIPPPWIIENLMLLAQRLQVIRDFYNLPITITSGYRTPAHNAKVGGHPRSYHIRGMAADIVIRGVTPRQLQKDFANWSGGMGCYDTFTHLDIQKTKKKWGQANVA